VTRNKKTTGRKGFTLIELLVVIAIIAILAAILFPVFAKARARARSISCLSNMKNLAMGIHMYTGDYDGCFPMTTGNGENAWENGPPNIVTGVLPYVGNSWALFRCPNDNVPREGYHACTYGFRRAIFGYKYPGQSVVNSLNMDDIKAPAGLVLNAELSGWMISGWPQYSTVESVPMSYADMFYRVGSDGIPTRLTFHHPEGKRGNFNFADGHAKAIDMSLPVTAWLDYAAFGWGDICDALTLADMYTLSPTTPAQMDQYASPTCSQPHEF